MRWKKDGKAWLYGSYEVRQSIADRQWDISDEVEGGYLCSTRYVHRAKWICEQLHKAANSQPNS